jgi:flagellar M-ring protein FliF
MLNSLSLLKNQVKEIWRQFGVTQRTNVMVSMVVVVASVLGLIYWSTKPDYRLLYSNLTLSDAAKMREKLEESKINVSIGQSGMSISVPAADLYTARLILASEGLPNDASTGFELFEQPKFGLTDFAQKVNYQRALQGELERTISAMQGVRSARIMLVLPKEHLFSTEKERKAQASILLNLNGSYAMGDAQVQSIVHLVSGSVQNLDPGQVTVTDQHGRLLTNASSSEDVLEQSSEQLTVQARAEKRMVEKAQAILDRALGAGNSIVRVNLEMDFSDIERRSEEYHAEDRVALSERIITEDQSGGAGGAGGVAGVMANVTVGDPANMNVDKKGPSNKKEEITTEYVVPTSVSTTRRKGVYIQQMTVAVALARGDGERSAEEIEAIEQLVSKALGLNPVRKDSISVQEMAFVAPSVPEKAAWYEALPFSYDSLFKGMGGLVALFFVFGVSRKVKVALLANNPSIEAPAQEVRERAAEEELMKDIPMALEDQLEMIADIARDNPKTLAAWISSSVGANG